MIAIASSIFHWIALLGGFAFALCLVAAIVWLALVRSPEDGQHGGQG